ncbi:MAG: hypothetical protein ACLTCQ_08440 [Enterocloster bolteae]
MSPINHYKTTIYKKTIGAVLAAGCFLCSQAAGPRLRRIPLQLTAGSR